MGCVEKEREKNTGHVKEPTHSIEVDKLLLELKTLKKSVEASEAEGRETMQLVHKKNMDIDALNGNLDNFSSLSLSFVYDSVTIAVDQLSSANAKIKALKDEKLDFEKKLAEEQGKDSIRMVRLHCL